ncbi:Lrp/AsnC family transcriptional regulator [Pokkaliibacter sp. CJK22405]|uniref:Lrp/AsnC family transcriptional regulator n=1 Tax=Pokkaliibacter sp. CJK22405 TaxID=3384615 RepID=UPI0039851DDB
MDKFDRHILGLLRDDARLSVTEVARRVSLSRTAVSERIRQLEEQGVIRGYHARIIEPDAELGAYLEIIHRESSCEDFVTALKVIPEIQRLSSISGDVDLLVFLQVKNMARLIEIRNLIEKLPGTQRVKTHVIMREWLV